MGYHDDCRVTGGYQLPDGEVDEQKLTLTVEFDDEENPPVTYVLPLKYEVCDVCEGRGTHVNPSIDGEHGLTAEDFADWDRDDVDGYFNGRYDVTCNGCHGKRVKLHPCPAKGSPEAAWLEGYERDNAEYEAQCRMERRMGC